MRCQLESTKKAFVALALILIYLIGCATPIVEKPVDTPITDNHVITTTSGQASTFIIDRNAPFIFCSQPQPDAAYTQQDAAQAALDLDLLTYGTGSEGAGAQEQSAELEMMGRTPAIMLARELLYRLCEFNQNQAVSQDQAIRLYELNLALIKSISTIEAENTTVQVNMSHEEMETINVSESTPVLPTQPTD